MKKEEALNLVRKENDLLRYQKEKEEANRSQGAKKKRMRKWLGHHQETSRTGLIGKRRELWKKTRGGWSQREKRRCQRSLSCRMRSKAITWTLMAKATASMQKQQFLEEKEKYLAKSYLCPHCNSFLLEDYVRWVSGENPRSGGQQIVEKKYDWKQPNRLLVVQSGDSVEQARVFKAHAVSQGLYENLINALKLLANQQEDGDGFLQTVLKNLGNESRRGLTDGLREFI